MGRAKKAVARARELRKQSSTRFAKIQDVEDNPTYCADSESESSRSDRSMKHHIDSDLDSRDGQDADIDDDLEWSDGEMSSESADDGETDDSMRESLRKMYEVFLPRYTHPHLEGAEKKLQKKVGKRPAIYTGDSERSKQRKRKEERERLASIQDCDAQKFMAFFKTAEVPLNKKHHITSQTDPSLNVIDPSDLNLTAEDNGNGTDLEISMWSCELEAILDGQQEDWFSVTDMEGESFDSFLSTSNEEVQENETEIMGEAEHEGIRAAREWTQESPEDEPAPANIMEILQGLMKTVKRCKTQQALKAIMPLTGLVHFVKLREQYRLHPKCYTPVTTASLIASQRLGRGSYFARQLRELEPYVLRFGKLPPSEKRAIVEQQSLLNNENIIQNIRSYLAVLKIGEITPHLFMQHVNSIILPSLGLTGAKAVISESTAYRWLGKLGYQSREVKKGIYIDGHERPDVIQSRKQYISKIREYQSAAMPIIDDTTAEIVHPLLPQECPVIIAIHHDEMSVATNEQRRRLWLGKNGDSWWDCSQLLAQIKNAIPIFEFLHPGAIGIWIFDCSSAHESFAEDALNVKNMNINPGGKQRCLRQTIIPLNNPPPEPGEEDMRGKCQLMVYAKDHPDPNLRGKAKGIKAVLQERTVVWRELVKTAGGNPNKVIGICKPCKASQAERDHLLKIAALEQAEGNILVDDGISNISESTSNMCCMTRALSQQQDFLEEKPQIQRYIEKHGHICLFLPKFHPELDPIEMYWGWTKHQYRTVSDQKFSTAKALIPQILNSVDVKLIRKFFRKTWRYLDAYEKGLDAQQAAFAVKIYKSHRRIGAVSEVLEELKKRGKSLDTILQLLGTATARNST
ncbi:hypothetical protein M422DRAFT_246031 [Sphaerobolus stellatus SS14]|nr:hypothetical protein M422DRAFT_246031 [Sphaerobolus stellatus SS14]